MLSMICPLKKFVIGTLFVSAIVCIFSFRSFSALVYSNFVDPLDAGAGTRALGMGRAFVAAADDINSIFLNPAGLAYTKNWGMTCGISSAVQDTSTANFGMFFSTGSNEAFGFGIVGSGTNNPLTAVPTRELSTGRWLPLAVTNPSAYSNSVAILSYGTSMGKYLNVPVINNLSVGLSLKGFFQLIGSDDGNFRANGFDVDLGMIYPLNSWLKFGAYGQNILEKNSGGKFVWTDGGTEEAIPADYKLGISTKVMGDGGIIKSDRDLFFNFDAEQEHSYYDKVNPPVLYHAGIEWHALDYLIVRGGLDQISLGATHHDYSTENDYTGGLGYKYGDFSLDYAYHRYGDDVGNDMHYFSVTYAFGSGAETQKISEAPPPSTAEVRAATPEVIQATPEAVPSTPEVKPVVVATPETMTSKEEYLSIVSPDDKSIIYTDSVPVSCDIINDKVARVEINGISAIITSGAQKKAIASVSIPSAGKVALNIRCFDANDLLLKEYKVRLLRLPVFTDLPNYSYLAKDKIIILSALNILSGYPNGTFKPNKPVTRAELTSILVKTFGYVSSEAVDSGFIDVKKDNWASYYIQKGTELGFVSGYSGDIFKPSNPVTRAEGIAIISRFAGLNHPEKITRRPFRDVPLNNWAAKAITAAKEAGLLDYYYLSLKGGRLIPNKPMTRAEVAATLSQTEFLKKKITDFLNWDVGY